MSLINDALKRAKQAPPRNPPNALPSLQPATEESSPIFMWLLLAVIILLIFAAIFFIGWSVAHHNVRRIVADQSTATNQEVAVVPPVPVVAPKPETPAPLNPPDAPVLQGIFYSPTAPSAIVDGKTVRPGDKFKQYTVKEISKYTVTLIGPDGKPFQLGMGN
jgi:hypothetical protein